MPANAGIFLERNTMIVITEQQHLLEHNAQWMSVDQQNTEDTWRIYELLQRFSFFPFLSFGIHIPK